ncbi:MAG: 23S rRNA (uracil(1939)-C(5))-methyltransferase RlmD, partial [Clostridia bacterium]|nr:23S rRNA (uracil(1939)-C(5))-methyltransferase RlmD [Clostridia bacterium]
MIEKNDIICAVAEAMGSSGEGIIRHEGITFFVPACLPGEKVRFRVLKIKGNIGYGKLEEVLTPAEERVRIKCPVFLRCGGCSLQHLDYEAQLIHKSNVVKEALRKIGGINAQVPVAVKSDLPYGYRNKLQMPIGIDNEGNTVIGFYAERSHRIVPIATCAIHPEWAEKLISILKRYCSECAVKGYDEVAKTGSLRHIVAREIGGNFIFTLVTAKREIPNLPYLIGLLGEYFKSFTLYLNFNAEATNVILGKEFHLVHGAGVFEDQEHGIRYEAGPVTFLQVNENVRAKLYKDALKTVTGEGDEVVIDAYSGGGLLTAMIAKKAKRVYGIELEAEASKCADALKAKNKLENMTNICGAVEDKLPAVLEKERGEKLRLILDPPRAGIARSVLKALLESGIEKLTLISCNPATLARDLGILTGRLIEENGELVKNSLYADQPENETLAGYYEIQRIQPYDMFPQTKHVETLVQLSHKKPDTHLEVALDFEDETLEQSLVDVESRVKSRERVKVTY